MMSAGRRHLECPACDGLTAHVGQIVDLLEPRIRFGRVRARQVLTREPTHRLAEMRGRVHREPLHKRRLGRCSSRA